MPPRTKYLLLATAGIAAAAAALAFTMRMPIEIIEEPMAPTPQAQRVTLTGTYVCLPHADPNGPQTKECALGLQTDDGTYYALDFNLSSQMPPNIPSRTRITATGLLTPIEFLSTDFWRKYPITAIFSVTDSVQILEEPEMP